MYMWALGQLLHNQMNRLPWPATGTGIGFAEPLNEGSYGTLLAQAAIMDRDVDVFGTTLDSLTGLGQRLATLEHHRLAAGTAG